MNCLVVVVVTALVSVSVTQGYLSTNRYRWKTQTNRDLTSSIRSTITNNEEYISSSLSKDLQEVCNANNYPLRVQEMFYAMMVNDDFRTKYYQKKPFLITHNLPNLAGAFTMNDVKTSVESDFLEAGRGTFQEGRSGWNMAAVSRPKGKSYEDAKLKYDEVEEALRQQNGTVVFNSAGGFIPKLAEVCLQTLNAFQLPVAINMYLTNPGQKTSAPPHTDKQDVFVLQTQGYKRWRVFNPPPPNRLFKADPFARGKGTDVLELEELEQPLIDTVLSPGQVLYVPAGFPHTTGRTFYAYFPSNK